MELFAITRAAIGAAPHDEGAAVNSNCNKVASASRTEALLAAAASEYLDLASVLNDSGNQVAQKQVSGGAEHGNSPSSEQGIGSDTGALDAPLIPPAVTFPPTGVG